MRQLSILHLKLAFVFGLTVLFGSCSTKTTSSNDESSDAEDCEEIVDYPEAESAGQLYTIVPIYETKINSKNIDSPYLYYAIKEPNGQYIMFDNEGSYVNYAPSLCFISRISEHLVWSDENLKEKRELLSSVPELDSIRQKVIVNALHYIRDEKDLIKDRKLFKEIDKVHYDDHLDERNFYQDGSRYGWKSYSNVENKIFPALTAKQYDRESSVIYFTANRDTLPDGALILAAYQ